MNFPKIVITTNKDIFKELSDKFSLTLQKRENNISVYKPGFSKENILIITGESNLEDITKYIFENYLYEGLIYIGTAKKLSNIDLIPGDVIIPNTFITDKSDFAIFATKTIGENYDLKKFGLILSGMNLTSYKNETGQNTDFAADIIDNEVYGFVKLVKEKDELEKIIVLKIIENGDKEVIKSSIIAIDFFL